VHGLELAAGFGGAGQLNQASGAGGDDDLGARVFDVFSFALQDTAGGLRMVHGKGASAAAAGFGDDLGGTVRGTASDTGNCDRGDSGADHHLGTLCAAVSGPRVTVGFAHGVTTFCG